MHLFSVSELCVCQNTKSHPYKLYISEITIITLFVEHIKIGISFRAEMPTTNSLVSSEERVGGREGGGSLRLMGALEQLVPHPIINSDIC